MVAQVNWSGDQFYSEATAEINGHQYRVQRLAGLYYVMGVHFSLPIMTEPQLLACVHEYHRAQTDSAACS